MSNLKQDVSHKYPSFKNHLRSFIYFSNHTDVIHCSWMFETFLVFKPFIKFSVTFCASCTQTKHIFLNLSLFTCVKGNPDVGACLENKGNKEQNFC